ncbi:hypothetical protein IHE45_08G054000 [Dioscorea alata]|uniref:Uncharacterized protein n=1 Tax=Dioscorea alata TaxID=55571 RepID=A0ACB7VJH5_DIOAL|nr:hypothetical protein IHE45_08G054000 [Dioscorea alata]
MASSNSLLVFPALLGIILILSLEVVSARELLQRTEEKVVEAGYEEQKASTGVNYGFSFQPVPTNGYYYGFQPKENVDKAEYVGQKALVQVGLPLLGSNYNGYGSISLPAYGSYAPNSGVQPIGNYPGAIYSSSFYNSYPYVIGYGGQP